jgi:hypothetical protein
MSEFGEELGEGSFHTVYLHKQTPMTVVRRLINRKPMELLQSQQKMQEILESPIRELLPSKVTNYNDNGDQFVTRCARLETGGKIENLNGGIDIQIPDSQMQQMAVEFLYVLNNLFTIKGTRPAFFDAKMDNLGVETLHDGSMELRIIDVDPDDAAVTYTCFTPQYWKENRASLLSGKYKDAFIRYQSTFTVIAAFIAWMLPDNDTFTEQLYHNTNTPVPSNYGAMYSLTPRLRWLRQWLEIAKDVWPETSDYLNTHINYLNGQFDVLGVPVSFRAPFGDLAVSQSARI